MHTHTHLHTLTHHAPSSLASSQYAHYLDVVEVEFSNQVAQRSAGILQILATFRELHKDVRRACRQLTEKVRFAYGLCDGVCVYRVC